MLASQPAAVGSDESNLSLTAPPSESAAPAPAPPAFATSLTPGQFRAASAAIMMTMLLAALDQTIVSVAVPTIAHQLGGFEWMAWVISGYLIACTVVTPLYGKLSDLIGRRQVMSIAIVVFLIASTACALAHSLPQLVVARVLQGVGGGGLIATAQSVVADVVPLRERGRYQSYISIVWVVASMLGPVVGGVLTEYLSWPWIFWVNLPVGLLALALVRSSLRALPVLRGTARIDALGAVLLLAGLTALLIPITRVGQGVSWGDGLNLAGWTIAAVLLAVFVLQQRRHPDAIVPIALFKNRTVVACCAILFICFFNFIALSVLVPLRLQLVAGLSAAEAGLRLLPMTLAVPTAAFLSGRWLTRTGRLLPMQKTGALLVPAALLAMSFSSSTGIVAGGALIVLGMGMGLQMPTALISVQQSVPRHQIGTVTALTAFFRQLGGAIGIAILSSMVLLLLRDQLPVAALATEGAGLGPLLDAARSGHGSAGLSDHAFREVMRLSAGVACTALWLVWQLPELAAQDSTPAQQGVAATAEL